MRTVEELEALLETVTRERDHAHARWVAIINNRGTTISDVETLTNDLNVALSQRDKVRVELREARILTQEIGDVCRGKREPSKGAAIILGPLLRERDEARAEVERLTWERDEARANYDTAASVNAWHDQQRAKAERERDEARAEVERLRHALALEQNKRIAWMSCLNCGTTRAEGDFWTNACPACPQEERRNQ